jgi:hypothetical protein
LFFGIAPLLLLLREAAVEQAPFASDRDSGFWEIEAVVPRTANRFILTIASEVTVGFTILEKLNPRPVGRRALRTAGFCACAET